MTAVVHQALLMVQMPQLEWPLDFDEVDATPVGDTILTTYFTASHGVTFPGYPLWGDGPTPTGSIVATPGTTAPGPLQTITVDRSRGYKTLKIRFFWGIATPAVTVRDTVRGLSKAVAMSGGGVTPVWGSLITIDLPLETLDPDARIDQIDITNPIAFYSFGDFTLLTT